MIENKKEMVICKKCFLPTIIVVQCQLYGSSRNTNIKFESTKTPYLNKLKRQQKITETHRNQSRSIFVCMAQ